MKGIRFGGLHTYDDLDLILSKKEIGSPAVKTKKIDVEGADGELDLTDFFGEPKYENVRHKFEFSTIIPQTMFITRFSAIKNALHGKKLKIILDDEPGAYYVGRLFVSSFTDEKGIGKVTIEADCEPWKYKAALTVIRQTITEAATITLANARKRAVPEVRIETDDKLRLTFGSNVWDLGAGSYTLPELELVAGENVVEVTGAGTITFTYQEGDL
ncbi:MAG: hypothetical protein KH382_08835 [Clostridiales bacterium]|nr:hypothetical protein [Clostridiales bacterium]